MVKILNYEPNKKDDCISRKIVMSRAQPMDPNFDFEKYFRAIKHYDHVNYDEYKHGWYGQLYMPKCHINASYPFSMFDPDINQYVSNIGCNSDDSNYKSAKSNQNNWYKEIYNKNRFY